MQTVAPLTEGAQRMQMRRAFSAVRYDRVIYIYINIYIYSQPHAVPSITDRVRLGTTCEVGKEQIYIKCYVIYKCHVQLARSVKGNSKRVKRKLIR